MNTKKRRYGFIQFEVTLIFLIIIGVTYMTIYEGIVDRYTAISVSPRGKVAVLHNQENAEIFRAYGWPVINFHHDSTEFIIMYNSDQEEVFQLMLGDVIPLNDVLYNMEDWWGIFKSNSDGGKVHIKDKGVNMIINYEWIYFDDISYLLVYNTSIELDNLMNIFRVVSYLVIILLFILLMSIVYHRCFVLARRYHEANIKIHDIISKN